jgi:hypothetical protein
MLCPLAMQSERSSSVHNFETRDNLPFMFSVPLEFEPFYLNGQITLTAENFAIYGK